MTKQTETWPEKVYVLMTDIGTQYARLHVEAAPDNAEGDDEVEYTRTNLVESRELAVNAN